MEIKGGVFEGWDVRIVKELEILIWGFIVFFVILFLIEKVLKGVDF